MNHVIYDLNKYITNKKNVKIHFMEYQWQYLPL